MIKLLTLAALSAAINSSFGRVSSLTGATLVLAITRLCVYSLEGTPYALMLASVNA